MISYLRRAFAFSVGLGFVWTFYTVINTLEKYERILSEIGTPIADQEMRNLFWVNIGIMCLICFTVIGAFLLKDALDREKLRQILAKRAAP